MASEIRMVFDDKPISWYMGRGEGRPDALKRTLERAAEWMQDAETLETDQPVDSGTMMLEHYERYWFSFRINVPD